MSLNVKLKCNPIIFEKKIIINVDEQFVLKPIFENSIELESKFYLKNCSGEKIKKYLPNAYVENEEQAKEKLLEFISNTILFKTSILFCIRTVKEQFPIGYINLESPLSFNGLGEWSIDFWLAEQMEGRNIMITSIYYCLNSLKEYDISIVKAVVDEDNLKSRSLLEKLDFEIEHIVSEKIIYTKKL